MESLEETPESRRAARRAVEIACDLVSQHWDSPVRSQCTDLSAYGMWLETTMPLHVGETVVLSFCVPERDHVMTLFAMVKRVDRDEVDMLSGSAGVGLEFENMTVWERRILSTALRGRPPHLPGHKRDRRAPPPISGRAPASA